MALGIGSEPEAGLIDRAVLADAGEHVLERAARRAVIEHVVGRDQIETGALGQRGEHRETLDIIAAIAMLGSEIAIGQATAQLAQEGRESVVRGLVGG